MTWPCHARCVSVGADAFTCYSHVPFDCPIEPCPTFHLALGGFLFKSVLTDAEDNRSPFLRAEWSFDLKLIIVRTIQTQHQLLGKTMARTRWHCRPRVERLEDRFVADAGSAWDAFLLTPISENAHLAMHIHPHLRILVDGIPQLIPANIGVQRNGDATPIHTHDETGLLHIESPIRHDYQLQDFFTIWGQPLSPQQVLGYHADATHSISMTVDGRPNTAFGALVLRDREDIVIRVDTLRAPRGAIFDPTLVAVANPGRLNSEAILRATAPAPSFAEGSPAVGPTAAGFLPAPALDPLRTGISGGSAEPGSVASIKATNDSANGGDSSKALGPSLREEWEATTPEERTGEESNQFQSQAGELSAGAPDADENSNPGS